MPVFTLFSRRNDIVLVVLSSPVRRQRVKTLLSIINATFDDVTPTGLSRACCRRSHVCPALRRSIDAAKPYFLQRCLYRRHRSWRLQALLSRTRRTVDRRNCCRCGNIRHRQLRWRPPKFVILMAAANRFFPAKIESTRKLSSRAVARPTITNKWRPRTTSRSILLLVSQKILIPVAITLEEYLRSRTLTMTLIIR